MAIPILYKVTASALNLRSAPAKTAPRLGALPRDAVIVRTNDPSLADDWYKVEWNGRTAYAASAYLQPVPNGPSAAPAAAEDIEMPAAGAVQQRDRDMAKLHPAVRVAVQATLDALAGKDIPFRVFEGFRTPERQRWLYAQGRTRPGGVVTRAQAWQSMHQYGLAVDLVLFTAGGWSWDDSGDKRAWWKEMQAVAKQNGLSPLSFELPHVELVGSDWRALQQGNLPDGGDESWFEALAFAAERWHRGGHSPYGPRLNIGERPTLPP